MSNRWRRFEVLLPVRFNDGRDVPPDWLAEAVLEIVDRFVRPVTRRKKSRVTGATAAFFIGTILCGSSLMCPTRLRIGSG